MVHLVFAVFAMVVDTNSGERGDHGAVWHPGISRELRDLKAGMESLLERVLFAVELQDECGELRLRDFVAISAWFHVWVVVGLGCCSGDSFQL